MARPMSGKRRTGCGVDRCWSSSASVSRRRQRMLAFTLVPVLLATLLLLDAQLLGAAFFGGLRQEALQVGSAFWRKLRSELPALRLALSKLRVRLLDREHDRHD